MPEVALTIRSKVGLHARPAALFVQTASRFGCRIEVGSGGRRVNAKSILGVLSLGVGQGATVTIQAEGTDAEEALAALQHLVNTNFQEEA